MKGKCSEKVSLMRVRRLGAYCHATLRRWSFIRMIAPRHTRMRLGERGFCVAALYAISPPSHFGNASLPHWSVQSHWPRLLALAARQIKLRAWKSVFLFRGFSERFLFALPRPFRKHDRLISSRLCALPLFSARLRGYELIICWALRRSALVEKIIISIFRAHKISPSSMFINFFAEIQNILFNRFSRISRIFYM